MTDSAQTKTVKKTKTLDEEIESRLADRKIALFRYDAHLRQQIYKKLTALQKRLLNRVTAAGIESISKKELNLLLKDITKLINESYADVSEFSRDELNQLLPVEIASTQQIYNKAVKFDLFNSVPDYKIKAIQNSQLIAGSPLESWWAKQGNELSFKFSNIIRQGMLDGKATSELILESKDLLASSRRWAETLVRTAVMKVHDQAQQALRDENLDIIKGEQHISTLDTRTSEVCRVRDGKAWDLNKKPIGDHDLPYQRPPIHPNCRSTLRLLTKSWQELGIDADEIPESTRASMDGQVKASLNYEDWLKGKSPEEQDAVLGKGKADLWRRGVITFRDMLDQSGRPLTLAQLKEGGSRWQEHFKKMNMEIPTVLPNDLQSVVEIGKSIHYKHKDILDKAIADGKPHEGIMEILKLEGVELGGEVDVIADKYTRLEEFSEAISRYPKNWVELSNVSGKVIIAGKDERAYQLFVEKESTQATISKRFSKRKYSVFKPFLRKGEIIGGDSLILANTTKTRLESLSTHVHEYGHRLQDIKPDLNQIFINFWRERTKGLPIERLKKVTGINYDEGEITIKDHFPDPYYGKIYRIKGNEMPLEMLTMTFESLLGGKLTRFNELYEKDLELFHLGLALLARFK